MCVRCVVRAWFWVARASITPRKSRRIYIILFFALFPRPSTSFFFFSCLSQYIIISFSRFSRFFTVVFFFLRTRDYDAERGAAAAVCPIISDISLFSSLLPGSCHASARVVVVDGAE